jgi:exodeoxyribonuclease V alpha subunit
MVENIWQRLAKSPFRSKFRLSPKDRDYAIEKGKAVIYRHTVDFVAKRLAPSDIKNDGKQTPMRGHPVFVAQHATACCCRGCLEKWHHIPKGRTLTTSEQEYIVNLLMTWIERHLQ